MKITKQNIKDVFKSKMQSIETCELLGYEYICNLFADSSGFGREDEWALTPRGLEYEVNKLVEEHGTIHSFITSAGMFQVNIGIYKKHPKSKDVKKIALNLYKVNNDNEEYLRFYNTDIIRWEADYVILKNGGYNTVTTKKHINAHLPQGVYIFQKNFEWYVKDGRDDTVKPFEEGMKIAS